MPERAQVVQAKPAVTAQVFGAFARGHSCPLQIGGQPTMFAQLLKARARRPLPVLPKRGIDRCGTTEPTLSQG
jgi:hypothetical protein